MIYREAKTESAAKALVDQFRRKGYMAYHLKLNRNEFEVRAWLGPFNCAAAIAKA